MVILQDFYDSDVEDTIENRIETGSPVLEVELHPNRLESVALEQNMRFLRFWV